MRYVNWCLTTLALVFFLKTAGAATPTPTVAVFDFGVGGAVIEKVTVETGRGSGRLEVRRTTEASLLTNKLITALTKTKKVAVVERQRIDAIMREMKLTQAEMTDPKRSVQMGKLLGADYFVFGSLSMLEGRVDLIDLPYGAGTQRVSTFLAGADIRVVETETSRIIAAESKKVRKTQKELNPRDRVTGIPIEFQHEVCDALVGRLVDSVIDALFPLKVAAFSEGIVYLNRGGLAPGTLYRVVRLGEAIHDPDTGELLGLAEKDIATVKIVEGLERHSKAQVVEWKDADEVIPKGALCRRVVPAEEERPPAGG